jgi:hypothetical protein
MKEKSKVLVHATHRYPKEDLERMAKIAAKIKSPVALSTADMFRMAVKEFIAKYWK